ncbi:MAG TPA: hypothetical protein VG429_10225, partial [Casimicrobiaceae bacterium]|nr:hypothetical protein [Casimicrobiaceae bacterium]
SIEEYEDETEYHGGRHRSDRRRVRADHVGPRRLMPGAGHYRATRHCERGVWGEDDPMSKLDAALEKNEDA